MSVRSVVGKAKQAVIPLVVVLCGTGLTSTALANSRANVQNGSTQSGLAARGALSPHLRIACRCQVGP